MSGTSAPSAEARRSNRPGRPRSQSRRLDGVASIAAMVMPIAAAILGYIGYIAESPVNAALVSEKYAAYSFVSLFGGLVAFSELVGRYRDEPLFVLKTPGGISYIVVNAGAALGALWIIRSSGWQFGAAGADLGIRDSVAQVLVAGFGAMALFRSSLFNARVGSTDIAVGPAAVLQVMLFALDRSCDRRLGARRSAEVKEIMKDVSFTKAKDALTYYCLRLLQNVPEAEQSQVAQAIRLLVELEAPEPLKSRSLGLILMSLTGDDLLKVAVEDLRAVLSGVTDEELRLAGRLRHLSLDKLRDASKLCQAITPLADDDQYNEWRADVEDELSHTQEGVKSALLAIRLQHQFGEAAVRLALSLLGVDPDVPPGQQPGSRRDDGAPQDGGTPGDLPAAPPNGDSPTTNPPAQGLG